MDTLLQQAHKLLQDHKWEVRVQQDLEFIADRVDESAIQVFDKEAGHRVRNLLESVKKMDCRMTQEHYLFIMQMANVLIGDDHSFINLQQFGDREMIKYAGFVATFIDGEVIVVHSRTPSIPKWSYIKQVNGKSVMQWLTSYIQYASPKTENPEVNLRRASAFLSVYNPFSPAKTLKIVKPDGSKQSKVTLDYIAAKKGMFTDKRVPQLSAPSLHALIHKLIYVKINEQPLAALSISEAQMLYFHMHGFPNMDQKLYKVIQSMANIRSKEVKWVVFDLRNNFGGSLSALNAAIHFLYGPSFIKSLNKSMVYNFAVSKEFIQQYYDQVILPIVSDEELSKPVKTYFQQFVKSFGKQSPIYKEQSKSHTSANFLEALQRQVANKIVKGKNDKIVILVTDSHCYSACTWTAHIMRRIPNVVLIGKHLSATKQSGNALRFDLPSMMGSLAIPQLFVSLRNANIQKNLNELQSPDIYLPDSVINSSSRLFLYILQNLQEFSKIVKAKATRLANQ